MSDICFVLLRVRLRATESPKVEKKGEPRSDARVVVIARKNQRLKNPIKKEPRKNSRAPSAMHAMLTSAGNQGQRTLSVTSQLTKAPRTNQRPTAQLARRRSAFSHVVFPTLKPALGTAFFFRREVRIAVRSAAMRWFPLLAVLIPAALASDVLDYSADFDTKIHDHDAALVEFFAPWCGHCKRLAPEYEKAATELKTNDPPVPLIKVDCTSDGGKDTCSKHGVSGYPTLKIFRGGEFSADYNGPREAGGIVKYMKAQVGPSSKELLSVADVEKYLSKDDVVIFGFFESKDASLHENFLKVADKQREAWTFGHSFDKDVLKKYGYKNQVVLFRPKILKNKFEESFAVYSGSDDKTELETFIKENYHGLVGHRTQDNYNMFQAPLLVAYYDVDYTKNAKGTNYWRNRILKVAQNYKGKLNFAVSNKDSFAAEMDDYGVTVKANKPAIAVRNSENEKFRMTNDFSVENLEKFLEEYLAGNVKAHLKSEPVPETNDGPVKVAVAENFKSLVTESTKDVLIEFYAPWCGHCKKLAPTYEEVGKTLADEDILVVKMDATANDVPSAFEVSGFPTLYWLPKNDKQNPRRYEGGREHDDFIKWIAKHATDELKAYDRSGAKRAKEEL